MTIKPGDLVISIDAVRLDLPHEENRIFSYRVLSIKTVEESSLGKPVRFLRLQHIQATGDFSFSAFEGYYCVWKSHEEVLAERLMR